MPAKHWPLFRSVFAQLPRRIQQGTDERKAPGADRRGQALELLQVGFLTWPSDAAEWDISHAISRQIVPVGRLVLSPRKGASHQAYTRGSTD